MQGVVSPYELQPLTPGVSAALLLCDSVVTLLPTPDTADVAAAQQHAPRFRQLLDAWSWSTPLWRNATLRPTHAGESPLNDIRDTCRRILATPALAPLAPLISASRFENPTEFLDALCRDILRGGADPAISIPLTAGLEHFAARHRLFTFTTPAASVAGRIESRTARPLFKIQLPLIAAPSTAAFEFLRERLAAPIGVLRRVLETLPSIAPGAPLTPAALQTLEQAQLQFTAVFQSLLDPLAVLVRKTDREAKVGLFASVSCVALDPDASLAAAARAANALSPGRFPAPPLPPADALARPGTLAFHVRPLPWDVARVP